MKQILENEQKPDLGHFFTLTILLQRYVNILAKNALTYAFFWGWICRNLQFRTWNTSKLIKMNEKINKLLNL